MRAYLYKYVNEHLQTLSQPMEYVLPLQPPAFQALPAAQVQKGVIHVAMTPPRHKVGLLSYSQLGIAVHLADDETRHLLRGGWYYHLIYRI